jgi:hypothetical protein
MKGWVTCQRGGLALMVTVLHSLKVCWDLIFHFLKAELDRMECPDAHVAHTDWLATAGDAYYCFGACGRRAPESRWELLLQR